MTPPAPPPSQDMKPKNIFLNDGDRLQLGDLGCSKLLKVGLARTQIGTPYYMSPELWKRHEYNDKSGAPRSG